MENVFRSRVLKQDFHKLSLLLGFAILFSCVGWSIYWYVAHRIALTQLQSTLARESREGRDWKCENLASGGFPFSIDIKCERPTITADTVVGPIVALKCTLLTAPEQLRPPPVLPRGGRESEGDDDDDP